MRRGNYFQWLRDQTSKPYTTQRLCENERLRNHQNNNGQTFQQPIEVKNSNM